MVSSIPLPGEKGSMLIRFLLYLSPRVISMGDDSGMDDTAGNHCGTFGEPTQVAEGGHNRQRCLDKPVPRPVPTEY